MRALQATRKTPAGEAEPVAAPSEDAYRKFILAGLCPFCGLGPYKVLAGHTNRAHAVDRKDLRERAGLTYSTSITDPTYHAERVAISKELHAAGLTLTTPPRHGTRKNISPAAKKINEQKLARARASMDTASLGGQAAKAAVETRLEPEAREAADIYRQVVAERGMHYGAVSETARRLRWPVSQTLLRVRLAERLGLIDKRIRATPPETRTCDGCDSSFETSRLTNWDKRFCSLLCANKTLNQERRKPPRTAVCRICGDLFTYARQGTAERTLCDRDDCRRELSRRAGSHPKKRHTD